jgi:hypothetical protein
MTNKAQAFTTLNAFANSRVELIKGMKDAGYTLETARDVVIEWACDKMKAGAKGFNVSKSGKVMLNSNHAQYETIKTIVRDVMHMMSGTTRHAETSAKKESDPVAAMIKAMGKLTAAQRRAVIKAFA